MSNIKSECSSLDLPPLSPLILTAASWVQMHSRTRNGQLHCKPASGMTHTPAVSPIDPKVGDKWYKLVSMPSYQVDPLSYSLDWEVHSSSDSPRTNSLELWLLSLIPQSLLTAHIQPMSNPPAKTVSATFKTYLKSEPFPPRLLP